MKIDAYEVTTSLRRCEVVFVLGAFTNRRHQTLPCRNLTEVRQPPELDVILPGHRYSATTFTLTFYLRQDSVT